METRSSHHIRPHNYFRRFALRPIRELSAEHVWLASIKSITAHRVPYKYDYTQRNVNRLKTKNWNRKGSKCLALISIKCNKLRSRNPQCNVQMIFIACSPPLETTTNLQFSFYFFHSLRSAISRHSPDSRYNIRRAEWTTAAGAIRQYPIVSRHSEQIESRASHWCTWIGPHFE